MPLSYRDQYWCLSGTMDIRWTKRQGWKNGRCWQATIKNDCNYLSSEIFCIGISKEQV